MLILSFGAPMLFNALNLNDLRTQSIQIEIIIASSIFEWGF